MRGSSALQADEVADVTPEAQQFLAQELVRMRSQGARQGSAGPSTWALAHFGGALNAFRAMGAVTDDEFAEWTRRAQEATGPGTSRALRQTANISLALPRPSSSPAETPSFPRFLRLITGPNHEYDFYGGRLRLIAIEEYDTEMVIQWRMAPLADVDEALPEEAKAAERDTLGLPEEERARLRRQRHLERWNLFERCHVTDDAGGVYRSWGGSASSGGDVMVGRMVVSPGLQQGARALRVEVLGLVIEVSLPADQGQ